MKRLYILFALSVILLGACRDEKGLPKACLGECTYYPSFLWSDADTCGVTKHLLLDFNKDAKDDEDTFVEMAFVDKEGNSIPDDVLERYRMKISEYKSHGIAPKKQKIVS